MILNAPTRKNRVCAPMKISPVSLIIFYKRISLKTYLWFQRREKDLWEFPGGKIESQESPFEAIKREVEEEVGFCDFSCDLYKIFDFEEENITKIFYIFFSKVKGDSELDGRGKWIELKDKSPFFLDSEKTFFKTLKIIEEFSEFLESENYQ